MKWNGMESVSEPNGMKWNGMESVSEPNGIESNANARDKIEKI